jgi:predicted ArsR family transcriptional regulator
MSADAPLFDGDWRSTSFRAGEVAARSSRRRRQQILSLLAVRPMTLFELAEAIGVHAHQISGRITDLKRDLLITPTGDRRENPATGCKAEVYRLLVGEEGKS